MAKNVENNTNFQRLLRFLTRPDEAGYVFSYIEGDSTNLDINEKLLKESQQVGLLYLQDNPNITILNQIEEFLNAGDYKALIVANLNDLINDTENQNRFLTELNFSRETLYQFNLPILFWISESTFPKLSNGAPDLYSQRRFSTVIFEKQNSKNGSYSEEFQSFTLVDSNNKKNKKGVDKTRLELLEEQYNKVVNLDIPRQSLLNEYVLPYMVQLASSGRKDRSIELYEKYKTEFDLDSIIVLGQLSIFFAGIRNIRKAIEYISLWIDKIQRTDTFEYADKIHERGRLYRQSGQFDLALKDFERAEVIYDKIMDIIHSKGYYNFIDELYYDLAGEYMRISEFAKAEKYVKKHISFYQDLSNKYPNETSWSISLTHAYANMARFYVSVSKYEKALAQYKQAIKGYLSIGIELHDGLVSIVYLQRIYYELGELYLKLGNIKEAESNLKKGIQFYREVLSSKENGLRNLELDHGMLARTLIKLVEIYIEEKKFNEAQILIMECVNLIKRDQRFHENNNAKLHFEQTLSWIESTQKELDIAKSDSSKNNNSTLK